MTSNSLAETSNHIQYNPTTYAKGKYAYVFQVHPAKLIWKWRGQGTLESIAGLPWLADKKKFWILGALEWLKK